MADDPTAPAKAEAPEPLRGVEASAAPVPEPVETTIKAWLDQHIRNSPVSRATEAWNHLTAALPALVAALKEA